MHAPVIQLVLGYLADFLLVLLCVLAFRYRLYLRVPVFTVFLILQTVLGFLDYIAYRLLGLSSHAYFYAYFLSDGILFVAQAACIFELACVISRPYAGLRRTVPKVLSYLMAIFVLLSVVDVLWHREKFGITVYLLERDLQIAAGVVLLILCAIAFYYSVFPAFFERYAIWGLVVNLLIPGINFALAYWLRYTNVVLGLVEILSFNAALIFWLLGLLRFSPLPVREKVMDFERQKAPKPDRTWADPVYEVLVFPRIVRDAYLRPQCSINGIPAICDGNRTASVTIYL